jgi:DNA-binding GntR family transcriptional regulator
MDIETGSLQPEVKVGRSVAQVLRTRILGGELVPGQRLIESDLIEELGVGRSAVREAFVQLDAEGFVELRHQKGATVVRLTRQELADLFAVRERLEGFGAFLAAQRIDEPGHREWLRVQRDNWQRAEMLQNEITHMEENVPFHEGIILMSGNARLVEILRRLHIPAYRQRFLQLLKEDPRRESVEDHLTVIDAILGGHADAAEAAMRLHVRRTGELALQISGLS